jgi:hypothetical protein
MSRDRTCYIRPRGVWRHFFRRRRAFELDCASWGLPAAEITVPVHPSVDDGPNRLDEVAEFAVPQPLRQRANPALGEEGEARTCNLARGQHHSVYSIDEKKEMEVRHHNVLRPTCSC